MNDSLVHALRQRFQSMFFRLDAERNSVPISTRGIECALGWFPIIEALCEELQKETDLRGAVQIKIAQVKEKFGGLRFYVDAASERQQAMIDFAQAMSFKVCEICSAPGTLVQEAQMRTRCKEHEILTSTQRPVEHEPTRAH